MRFPEAAHADPGFRARHRARAGASSTCTCAGPPWAGSRWRTPTRSASALPVLPQRHGARLRRGSWRPACGARRADRLRAPLQPHVRDFDPERRGRLAAAGGRAGHRALRFSGLNFLLSDGERLYAYRLGIFELHWLARPGQLLVASERVTDERWHPVHQDVLLVLDPDDLEEPHAERLVGDPWLARARDREASRTARACAGASAGEFAARARRAPGRCGRCGRRLDAGASALLVNPAAAGGRAAGRAGSASSRAAPARRRTTASSRPAASSTPGARRGRPPRPARRSSPWAATGSWARWPARCADRAAPLALVPGGRGNDFARVLGIPRTRPRRAAGRGGPGAPRWTWARWTGGPFVGIASLGFDSDGQPHRERRALRQAATSCTSYAALRALRRWRHATLRRHGRRRARTRSTGYSVAVGNSGAYGGGMRLMPHAQLDDGRLDVLLDRRATPSCASSPPAAGCSAASTCARPRRAASTAGRRSRSTPTARSPSTPTATRSAQLPADRDGASRAACA